jgi:hypothetical protein
MTMGWLRLFRWQKYHYFAGGRARCGRGVIPYGFDHFSSPRNAYRCKVCSALR